MKTKLKELLKLSGKLAIACQEVLESDTYHLSKNLSIMEECLTNYNCHVYECSKEEIF